MKKLVLILSLSILIFSSFTNPVKIQDTCSDWTSAGEGRLAYLYLKVCEYESGNSGYIKIKNENNKAVRLTYHLKFKNGDHESGSNKIGANSESNSSSCWNCAVKNTGGLESFVFDNVFFEGEEGFW